MKLGVLQARSSSVRMPGKVLANLLGEPMIVRQIERIRKSKRLDELVVATSVDSSDDELAEVLERHNVMVRRGPLEDVLARFMVVVEEFKPQTIVRFTGDNPLVDPAVVDLILEAHEQSGADCTSNSVVRTFPYGLDVECVEADSLRRLDRLVLTSSEREHVTLGLYDRPEAFSIHQVTQFPDRSDLRWTVDFPSDFEFVTRIYAELYSPEMPFGQREVVRLIEHDPSLRRTRADVEQ